VPSAARLAVSVLLALALFPCVIALGAAVSLRETAMNPAYLMDVLRETSALARVKAELLDGLVESSGLEGPERAALREALDEGVPVAWLEAQLQRILGDVAAYLASDETTDLSVELPVVELKVYLLPAIREHLGEQYYLQAALGLQSIPDSVDIGAAFDSESLRALRPFWRLALAAPWVAAGAALALSALVWLATGRGARGLAAAGGVWAAAGLAMAILAGAAGAAVGTRLFASLGPGLPELPSFPLPAVVSTVLAGVRSELAAAAAGALLAGSAALSLPRVERELKAARAFRPPRPARTGRSARRGEGS